MKGRMARGVALVALASGIVLAAFWRSHPPGEDETSLGRTDRRRAMTPLSRDAQLWLVAHRDEVRGVAQSFDISPIALGGIVAAEKTLLTGAMDIFGERVFITMFRSLREENLRRWTVEQERDYQRRLARGGGRPTLLTPYLWTLGPAQVSFRLAILYEPQIAQRLGRRERSIKEVFEAVSTVPGNLEYAAALLSDAQQAYAEVAGLDIGAEPGLLATLYHLGSPATRARRLAAENTARVSQGATPGGPRMNWYGAFVAHHAEEIAHLLRVPSQATVDRSS